MPSRFGMCTLDNEVHPADNAQGHVVGFFALCSIKRNAVVGNVLVLKVKNAVVTAVLQHKVNAFGHAKFDCPCPANSRSLAFHEQGRREGIRLWNTRDGYGRIPQKPELWSGISITNIHGPGALLKCRKRWHLDIRRTAGRGFVSNPTESTVV